MGEIHGSSPAELQPLKTLAEYFAYPAKRYIYVLSIFTFESRVLTSEFL